MLNNLKYIFLTQSSAVAPIYEILDRVYGTIGAQYWQEDQYQHVKDSYGSSYTLSRDEKDLNHPDRPQGIEDYLRTEFQKNARLFRPCAAKFTWETQTHGVKAKWLKGEVAKKVRWYLENIEAATDHPGLKVKLQGFDLFENPEALDALPDNERISLELKVEVQGENNILTPTEAITCDFQDKEGGSLTQRSFNLPHGIDLEKEKDRKYLGLSALHYLAMTQSENEDKGHILKVDRISFGPFIVKVEDIKQFSIDEDKGPKSEYRGVQAFRNKMSAYHPAFSRYNL